MSQRSLPASTTIWIHVTGREQPATGPSPACVLYALQNQHTSPVGPVQPGSSLGSPAVSQAPNVSGYARVFLGKEATMRPEEVWKRGSA
jgi:hypothetical protein